jgi:molecular chaperone DnaK
MSAPESALHAVGIDLGTTYSCLSYLTPQGQPMACPNAEGEMTTPSVVLFDGDEIVVGTEALRNAVAQPERVIQHAKRFMGDNKKCWVIDGHVYTPVDISSFIVQKLLAGAQERLHSRIRHAVITVPAQFSDYQRQRTIEAGLKAGLERVEIINEPVAAALCYVLGEGMWFAELADSQTVMVFDLGGGTFDLSLVRYNKDRVTVLASGGDLHLGGLDWNQKIEEWACQQFVAESPLEDPRLDRQSMQALAIDIEQAKRALSVRPRATVTVQHAGRRKSFAVDREYFELLTRPLVDRTRSIAEQMLRTHKLQIEGRTDDKERHTGWAHVNAVLVTGGASRMPMVRQMLQDISGTTLNSTLSPDQSIAHGAAYYSGMLLSGEKLTKSFLNKQTSARLARFKQQSVNARALGILVRDKETGRRLPHYLIPANTPLPVAARQKFGTVSQGQTRVNLRIIESGANPEDPYVDLGECLVEDLPRGLPEATPIEVTIRYDEQARVHVSAIEPSSGRAAKTTIVREENVRRLPREAGAASDVHPIDAPAIVKVPRAKAPSPPPIPAAAPAAVAPPAPRPASPPAANVFKRSPATGPQRPPAPQNPSAPKKTGQHSSLEQADRPILLCNACAEPFDARGRCPSCGAQLGKQSPAPKAGMSRPTIKPTPAKGTPVIPAKPAAASRKAQSASAEGDDDTEHMLKAPVSPPRPKLRGQKSAPPKKDDGEEEFWKSLEK